MTQEIACKIDDLQSKSEMVYSLQNALYVSIFCQDAFSKDNFEWAFTLLDSITAEMVKELKKLTEDSFENLRKEGDKL